MDKEDRSAVNLLIGLILLGIGLYIMFQHAIVTTGYGCRIGGIYFNSSLMIIPLIIGIIWKVVNPKSIIAGILIALGAICLVVSLLIGVRIHLVWTSLPNYALMLVCICAGAGFIIKSMLKK